MKKAILRLVVSVFATIAYNLSALGRAVRLPILIDLYHQSIWQKSVNSMGVGSKILKGTIIHDPKKLSIGKSVVIGENCHIWANGGLTIGDDSLIAAHCTLTTLTHDPQGIVYRETTISAPIAIGRNVWLGYGVRVMPGVTIGDNAIIGAGAIVNRDIPGNSVAVGVPARIVRQRQIDGL